MSEYGQAIGMKVASNLMGQAMALSLASKRGSTKRCGEQWQMPNEVTGLRRPIRHLLSRTKSCSDDFVDDCYSDGVAKQVRAGIAHLPEEMSKPRLMAGGAQAFAPISLTS